MKMAARRSGRCSRQTLLLKLLEHLLDSLAATYSQELRYEFARSFLKTGGDLTSLSPNWLRRQSALPMVARTSHLHTAA